LFLLLVLQVSLVFAQNEGAVRMSDVAGEVIFDEAKEQVNSLPTSPENVSLPVIPKSNCFFISKKKYNFAV
jgi:hypothetical protein